MHCAFLLPIMKRYGLAHLLDRDEAGTQFRKLLLETVLATDMGVHAQFMQNFQNLIDCPETFDITQKRILVCQALIKCADISNPVCCSAFPRCNTHFADHCFRVDLTSSRNIGLLLWLLNGPIKHRWRSSCTSPYLSLTRMTPLRKRKYKLVLFKYFVSLC